MRVIAVLLASDGAMVTAATIASSVGGVACAIGASDSMISRPATLSALIILCTSVGRGRGKATRPKK